MLNIAQNVQNKVNTFTAGQIFDYQTFPSFISSPDAVIKAVSRLVAIKKIERFSKGKFYVPKKGLFGVYKPTDAELIRSELYKNGRLRGYITGLSLYNQLGLTTQIPRTITIAINGGRQEKDYGTIRIRKIITRVPIQEKYVKLLQYLDVLKDIKKIPDSDINQSLEIVYRCVNVLSDNQQKQLLKLAMKYYSPQVRALLGLLLSRLKFCLLDLIKLSSSLNPITVYKLKVDEIVWTNAASWNIKS